jgi:ATP-dependent helicase/nuclease subunit A
MHALEESSYDYVEAFADVAERSFRRFAAEKRDRGVVDFSDLVLLTEHFLTSLDADERASVGFFPEDGTADRATNSYVMVDEFQDTNAVQWSVVKALTSADPEDPDATNVFLVGDDKQSIYRFRGADVSVFAAAKRQLRTANERAGVDEDTAPLRTNFRTLPEPLCAINGLFDRVFPRTGATPDGADDPWYAVEDGRPAAFEARSEPLVPARENRTGDGRSIDPVVEYVPAPVDADLREAVLPPDHDLHDAPTDDGDAVEARVVANRIARLLTDGTQVYEPVDEDDPEYDALDRGDDGPVERPRDARPDDVAVLLSSRSALSAYERALRDAGVPYTVVKGSGFFETPEVKTLVNLLRVLVDPSDGVSLYGLLRSPMFGCTDEELARLAVALDDEASPSLWATLRNADEERWSSIADDLERFRSYAGAGPDARPSVDSWSTLLTRVFDETGYLAAVAADERREKAVANVEEFRDRLRALSEDGVHSLTEVLHRIERRIESGSHDPEANVVESDRGGDDSAGGAVSILTIHEAKGMEYEVVVVPAVGRNFERASGAALDETFEFETVSVGGERRPVLGIKGPDPDDRYAEASTLARELATARRRAEERAEAKRLLYVACTRARDHLVLTGQHGSDDDGYPLGFAEPDPAGATTWRDWVQAVLFDDDTVDGDEGFAGAESALRTLVETGEYTRELSYDRHDGTTETGAFSVALPPESHEYRAAVDDVELRLDAFEGRGRATTGGGERALHVSPHECTSLNEGYATLGGDDGVFRVEDAGVQPGDGTRGERSAPGDLPAAVYGTLVHRLCEVRPPADAARAFARRVVEDERSSGKPIPESADVEAAISEAVAVADRARTAVEDALAGETVVASYDEYPIEATVDYDGPGLDRVELRGEIDHLAVTEEAYFLFDYKTDRPGGRDPASFVEAQTEHHRPQMLAYATALSAADPHRDVHVNLVFTEVGCRVGRLDETVDYERELFDLFAAHL